MTPRQRLLTTLRGERADRVPVSPFVQEEYLSWYWPDRPTVDRVVDATELAEELDFDLIAKPRALEPPHFLRRSRPGWEVVQTESVEGGLQVRRLEIRAPDRTLCREDSRPLAGAATAGLSWTPQRPLLADRDDIEWFADHRPALDESDREEMRQVIAQWRRVLGERGVLAPWGFAGVFNVAAELIGMDRLYVLPYEDESLYRRLMESLSAAECEYNAALAAAGADAIGLQGHIAGGASVGPEFFRDFVLPYERRVIEAIHAAGAFTVYHNCGFARSLYENYLELGMTVWETVAPPPRGDNSLAEAKARLGERIILLGNLDQVDFLKRASPAEVAAQTREIVRTGKPGGRYIFSTSDFLERGTPRENVVAMIEAAKAEGRY
ncbi:MAG: hypothetical protein N2652_04385 [Kiritimatiellae bacterium]|nr:hypothetical protein [Kiritimatiellia bacterium]